MHRAIPGLALILTGCGTLSGGSVVPPGGAVYDYSRTADGAVTLHIISARDLASPRLSLDKDGALVADAGSTSGLAVGAAQQAAVIQAVLAGLKAAGLLIGAK